MIIVRLSGGMGNQMFQYALGRSLALARNTQLGIDLAELLDRSHRPYAFVFRNYDLDLFSTDAQIVEQKQVPLIWRTYKWGTIGQLFVKIIRKLILHTGKEKHFHFDSQILDLNQDTYLVGYWQSYKYFEKYQEQIRKDFEISSNLPENVLALRSEIEQKNSVCLHIRRRDYVGNKFHEVVDKDYYKKALAILEQKTKIDCLYVFSDDIDWCRVNLQFDLPAVFVGTEYAGERAIGHFALMRSCKHFVIPNSTFSWWAAWLASNPNKIVIAPKCWFNSNTINTNDLLPNDWIRL